MFARATMDAGRFGASRSVVCAGRGMVATSQPLAAYEAVRVLEEGGSAVDAAVTAALVLSVTEPMQIGLGGDVLALAFDANTNKLIGLNSSGRTPASLTIEAIRSHAGSDVGGIGPHSIFAVTVPGAVDGWLALLNRFGRLDRKRIFDPAIRAATQGFAVAPQMAATWALGVPLLARQRASRETWLKTDGSPPGAGEIFRNSKLAASLRMVAEGGREAFYAGPLAQAIVQASDDLGGVLKLADFSAHRVDWVEPILGPYRGHTIAEMPPNAQGTAVLESLAILEQLDLAACGYASAEAVHYQIEATKRGLSDAAENITDSDQLQVSPDWFLDSVRIRGLFERISSEGGIAEVAPPASGGDTAFVCTADCDGNAVSLMGSLFIPWATGITAGSSGFLLQNRGHAFSLDPSHPNVIGPSKKTRHTILPAMVLQDHKPLLALGFVGGDMQVQAQVQFLCNLIDFKMDPQEALDAPRWRVEENGRQVACEPGLSIDLRNALATRGHEIIGSGGFFGGGQAVLLHPELNALQGVSDGRRDGCALGY